MSLLTPGHTCKCDPDSVQKPWQKLTRQGWRRSKEADLAQRLNAAQAAARDAADLAAAKEAELQLARQQLDAERSKGMPVEQDIERLHQKVEQKVCCRQINP